MKKKIIITSAFCLILAIGCNSQNKEGNKTNTSDTSKCPVNSYKGYMASPHGIDSYYDYNEGLECSKISNKPYLVYFSGHGSVQSRKMEALVWKDSSIIKLLKTEFVITSLYVDDKSKLNVDKQIISKTTGDTIKVYGKKQSYIEEFKFKDKVYPAYFIVNSKEQILAGPYHFSLDIKSFRFFLEQGIKAYKNNK